MIAEVNNNELMLTFASENIQRDREIVMAEITHGGSALQFAS